MDFHQSELFPSSPIFVKFDNYFYRSDFPIYDSDCDFESERDRPTISLSEKGMRIFKRTDTSEFTEDLKAFVNAVSKHFVVYNTIPWVLCEEVGLRETNSYAR